MVNFVITHTHDQVECWLIFVEHARTGREDHPP